MNCQQATRLVSDAQDRPLAVGDNAAVRVHLMMCVNCRRFKAQMAVLRQATGLLAQGAAPLPDEPAASSPPGDVKD